MSQVSVPGPSGPSCLVHLSTIVRRAATFLLKHLLFWYCSLGFYQTSQEGYSNILIYYIYLIIYFFSPILYFQQHQTFTCRLPRDRWRTWVLGCVLELRPLPHLRYHSNRWPSCCCQGGSGPGNTCDPGNGH